jgi:hypothetical protein
MVSYADRSLARPSPKLSRRAFIQERADSMGGAANLPT